MSKTQQAAHTPDTAPQAEQAAGPQQPMQALFGNAFLASLLPGVAELLPEVLGGSSLLGGDAKDNEETTTEPTDFSTQAQGLFESIDTDSNGHLSEDDIDRAMNDPDLSPEEAATVATLKKFRQDLEELSNDEWFDENDGITMDDLRAYERTGQISAELRQRVEGRYASGLGRINNASTDLFVDPSSNVDVNAIQQGALGNCQFLAAVGSLVAQDPGAINDMIEPQEDGTYRVTFEGHPAVTVGAPTSAEIALYSTSGADGMWLTLLERAYGQLQDPDALTPQDSLAGNGSSDIVEDLTGGSTNRDYTALTSEETTRERLQDALDNDRIVTAGLNAETEGLPGGHRYSVLDYDASSDTVTVRNPWGHTEHEDSADGSNDGTFTLTVSEFERIFDRVYYEEAGD